MARYMIRSTRNPAYAADVRDMMELLDVTNGKWPDEGISPRVIQGVTVWVMPRSTKTKFIRTLATCPGCAQTLAASRLPQHSCKGVA